jgi:hypothetical protein
VTSDVTGQCSRELGFQHHRERNPDTVLRLLHKLQAYWTSQRFFSIGTTTRDLHRFECSQAWAPVRSMSVVKVVELPQFEVPKSYHGQCGCSA